MRHDASAVPTVEALLSEAAAGLGHGGVPGPRAEARRLLRAALDVGAEALVAEPARPVGEAAAARFRALVARRARREPLAQILGVREFWSLDFTVTAATLDPRPDSETVVEAALAWVANRAAPLRLLDLGTGTGCLLAALLSELPGASGIGTDCSAAALAVARANAARLGLSGRAAFVRADWDAGLDGTFDLIVANPPYVPSAEIGRLQPEVALHEPRRALDGGADGLAAYRRLAPVLARRLAEGGAAFVEVGDGQAGPAGALLARAGLRAVGARRDLGGVVRCLGFEKPTL